MSQSLTRKAFKDALASSYSDYVRKKQDKGEEPLSQEDWERKTQGGSGDSASDTKDMGAIERLRKKRKENPMGKKPSAIDKKKSKERYLELSKQRREKMKQKALSKKQAHPLAAAWGFDKEAVRVPRQVTVRWDLGDDMPEYQDKDFRKALRKLRLPERVKIPAEVIEEWENEGRDDYIIDEWLSDEYGYLHYGWKAASVSKCGSGCPCTRCTCKRQAQELEDAWGSNQTEKTAGRWKNKVCIIQNKGDNLVITFMADTGEKYASVPDVQNLLVAFDKEATNAQSTPLPSNKSDWRTMKEGVVGGKNVSLFMTRIFWWGAIDSVEDENVTIKEIMDVLRSNGWKPSMGAAIL